ncbi:peptide transporter ptr2 [Neonectria magnoliae]|uniref:Peptide transporter ptr2 n=1 Tax=Neonectria magnoliae TaxID=2732573 RepID=A0ABR1HGU8_9HYPO
METNVAKEKSSSPDVPAQASPEQRDATEEEIKSLPHIIDKLPPAAWAAALIGASERLIRWAPSENYMQNDRGFDSVPGALGLGQSTATAISNAFFVFLFLMPACFAVVSDIWLGRYKTLLLGLWYGHPPSNTPIFRNHVLTKGTSLSLSGSLVMFTTSLPVALDHGAGVPGLAVAMILLGLGVGATKATVSPFIGEEQHATYVALIASDSCKATSTRNTTRDLCNKVMATWPLSMALELCSSYTMPFTGSSSAGDYHIKSGSHLD